MPRIYFHSKQLLTFYFLGTIDMDLITTGRSASSRGSLTALAGEVQKLLAGPNPPTRFDPLLKALQSQSDIQIAAQDLREVLFTLAKDEFLVLAGNTHNPEIRLQS